MKRGLGAWALFVAGVAVVLAACSGGGVLPAKAPGTTPQHKLGKITARVFVPKHRARVRRHGKGPDFLPPSVTEVDFTLTEVGGVPNTNTHYDFELDTGGNSGDCTPSDDGWACSVTVLAPAATDLYTIVAYACEGTDARPRPGRKHPRAGGSCPYYYGTLQPISETLGSFVVPPEGNVSAQFTLSPIVASLGWTTGTGLGAGPNTPQLSDGSYSCPGQYYNTCWDPILDVEGVPQAEPVALNAYDAQGEQIIPASGGGTTYGTPAYLTPAGDIDDVNYSCSDASLTFETGGGPYGPGQMTVANGAQASINTPVTSPYQGANVTSMSGVQQAAVGNNGIEMNFDGSHPLAAGSTQTYECTATDNEGNTATFYAGDNEIHPTLYAGDSGEPSAANAVDLSLNQTAAIGSYSFGSFNGPQSVASDASGRVYLADYSYGLIDVYPYKYTHPATQVPIGSPPSGSCVSMCYNAGRPAAVVVDDANARWFATDASSAATLDVFTVAASPSPVAVIPMPTPAGYNSPQPQALAVDEHGNVFVADASGSGFIYEYSPPFTNASQPVLTIDYGGLPTDLVYDKTNDFLYVIDGELNQVARYSIGGYAYTNEQVVTESSDPNVDLPAVGALDASGRLWLGSYYAAGVEVFPSFPNPGTLISVNGYGNPQIDALSFDGVGTMYVSTTYGATYGGSVVPISTSSYATTGTTINGSTLGAPTSTAYFNGAIQANGQNGSPAARRAWLLHRNGGHKAPHRAAKR